MNIADGLDHTTIRGVNGGDTVTGVLIRSLYQDVMSICSLDYCYAHRGRGALSVGVFGYSELQFDTNLYHL